MVSVVSRPSSRAASRKASGTRPTAADVAIGSQESGRFRQQRLLQSVDQQAHRGYRAHRHQQRNHQQPEFTTAPVTPGQPQYQRGFSFDAPRLHFYHPLATLCQPVIVGNQHQRGTELGVELE